MPVNLPPGSLAGLLARLAGASPQGDKGAKTAKTKSGKAAKSEAVSDEALLAELGIGHADKGKAKKNVYEKANVLRFLQDPKAEIRKMLRQMKTEQQKDTPAEQRGAERPEAPPEKNEMRETREQQRKDVRREERANEDAHAHMQETPEQKEARETHEARENQQQRERDEEEGKGAGGWVLEDADADEEEQRRGARDHRDLDDTHRCHGRLDDGGRCLRKPAKDSAFCGEHIATAGATGIDKL